MSSNYVRASDEASSICSDSTYQCFEISVDTDSCCHECENCEAVEEQRLEAEIRGLISEREEMKSKMCSIEETIAALEVQLLDTKSVRHQQNKHEFLCPACNQIKDPRQRKQIILQEIYREGLKNKPKELLCTFGLFKRHEIMINQGLMDTQIIPVEYLRCRKCRQVVESSQAKSLLVCDLAEVLGELEEQTTSGCSGEGVCGECLAHVRRFLDSPHPEPSGNTTSSKPDGGANSLVPSGESNETGVEEILNDGDKFTEINMKLQNQVEENVILTSKMETLVKEISALQNKIEEANFIQNYLSNINKQGEDNIQIPQLSLTEFTEEAWEDPKLILLSWEYELETFHVPRSKWTLFATRALKGDAQEQWIYSSQITWEEFTKTLLKIFDNKTKLRDYMNRTLQNIQRRQSLSNGNRYNFSHFKIREKFQLIKCISRVLDNNHEAIISLFNDIAQEKKISTIFDSFHSIVEFMEIALSSEKGTDNDFLIHLLSHLVKLMSIGNKKIK